MNTEVGKLEIPNAADCASPHKQTCNSGSFLLENSMTRREFQNKGKEMWQLINNRKEIEEKLKKLENRIKHIGYEQQRTEKIIEGTKKKHEKFSKIRDDVSQDKLLKNELKEQREKEKEELRKRNLKEKQEQRQKIRENKSKLIRQNVELKSSMNEKLNSDFLKKEQEKKEGYLKLREKCIRVSNSIKRIHHKRNSSLQMLKSAKNEEYSNKMQDEIKAQEDAIKKIQELELVEMAMLENFENTKKIQETVNSILSSPAHRDFNLLAFNL